MAESKIEIKVGGVSFSGEGGESWLSAQLDKMLKYLPELVTVVPPQIRTVTKKQIKVSEP